VGSLEHPPGAGDYDALAGSWFGWKEIGLHLGTPPHSALD
jgi:hypothetical protein